MALQAALVICKNLGHGNAPPTDPEGAVLRILYDRSLLNVPDVAASRAEVL